MAAHLRRAVVTALGWAAAFLAEAAVVVAIFVAAGGFS